MSETEGTELYESLEYCKLCPRECHTNRLSGNLGYCKAGAGLEIASISVHKGEEPVISGQLGICNVFFSHCNLQCMYCQNYQISSNNCRFENRYFTMNEAVNNIIHILELGVENLGFVSPTHMIPQMKEIIRAVHKKNHKPIIVYNSNGYDSVEILKSLENCVDVYLPDFKYSDKELASKWSDAPDYPAIAERAIMEMYRQKGSTLRLNENGIAENGLIIRHLVLPGEVNNSLGVLRTISEELSDRISISLMSQYHPIPKVAGIKSLNRRLFQTEYDQVVAEMDRLGFTKGWIQGFDSSGYYLPDFESENPFEESN